MEENYQIRSLKLEFQKWREEGNAFKKTWESIQVKDAEDTVSIAQRKYIAKLKCNAFNKANSILVQLNRLGYMLQPSDLSEEDRVKFFSSRNARTTKIGNTRTNRKYVGELPLESVYTDYADHRRMKMFIVKGFACANPECNRVGTRLIITQSSGGKLHPDIFTEDMHLMTNDHIIPLSKGGHRTDLNNLQPLCTYHNGKKGAKLIPY